MQQQDAAAVAPADDSADGQGGAAESVAQALVEESTATAELLLQDGSATEQQQDEVSISDAQQVTPSTSSTLALPEFDSVAAQLHDDTEATEGVPSLPIDEPVADAVQLASVVLADVDVLAASREPGNQGANQTLGTISQQEQQLKLDVVIDESAIAPVQTTAPVTNHAEHATDGNNTDLVIVEPSAAEVVSILTQTGFESPQIDSDKIKVVQPATVLESAVQDVPVSSTSVPQVSSPEQQPLVIGDDHIQTEPVRVLSESSDNSISGDITGAADAVNDKATAAGSSETAVSARTQEEPPICTAITTATDGAIDGDVALITAAVDKVVQATDVPDSIPDTIIATTEVNDNAAPLFTTAVVSSGALSDVDSATTAVTAIDDPQAASEDTIIVTTAATEQSVLSTAVPTVATAAAVVAATVAQTVTTAVTLAVTTQEDSAAAALPAEVTTETSTRVDAITTDVDTTLPSIPDEHASITAANVEEPVTVSVPSESATAAATPVTATLSTAAAVVTPAVITSAAAPPVVVAAAAVAAAATAASTYVIDGQALTLQHNAENAQAIEALLALVARLQMNTVSTAAAATTETATTVATDTAAPLTIAAVTDASAAAATVTTETQAVPAVVIDHDGGDNASAVHTGDIALSATANNTAVSEDDTIVLTEANVMAIQEQQLSDETAACVTVEMLPEAPTTTPVAIASTTTAANYSVQQQQQHEDVLSDADAADLADTSALNDAFDDDNDDTELAVQQQQQQQQQQALQADTVVVAALAVTEQSSMVHVRAISYTDSTTEEHKESDDNAVATFTTSSAIIDSTETADVIIGDDTTTADIAALVTSMVIAVVLKSDSTSTNDATSASNSSTVTTASHYDGAVAALTPLSPKRSVHEQLLSNGTLQSDAVTVQTAQSRRSLATNDLTVVVSGTTINGEEQRVRRRSSMAEYLSSPTQALQQLRAPSDKQRARNDSECENTADSAVDPYREHLGDDFRKTPWKPPSKSIAREDQRYNLFRRGNAKLWKVTNLDLFVLGEGVGLYFVWLNYLMVFTAIATVLSIPAILIR
eukprot:2689-Heterococcus_DN1.PRE.1